MQMIQIKLLMWEINVGRVSESSEQSIQKLKLKQVHQSLSGERVEDQIAIFGTCECGWKCDTRFIVGCCCWREMRCSSPLPPFSFFSFFLSLSLREREREKEKEKETLIES